MRVPTKAESDNCFALFPAAASGLMTVDQIRGNPVNREIIIGRR